MAKLKNTNLFLTDGTRDLSFKLSNFKGTESIILSNDKYLYIGYPKPIHSLYFDVLKNEILEDNSLVIEKYNGSEWVLVESNDETNKISESSFIFLDEMEEGKTTVLNKEMFFTRISTESVNLEPIELRYVNLVFCNENDLFIKDSNIHQYYPVAYDEEGNEIVTESLLLSLIDARNTIINDINRMGKRKYKDSNIEAQLFNQWDFWDVNEVRQAAIHMALANNYRNNRDSKDDVLSELIKSHIAQYNQEMNSFFQGNFLTLDSNDNGVKEDSEKTNSITNTFFRLEK